MQETPILLLAFLLVVVFASHANLEAKLKEVIARLRSISSEQERVRQEAADLKAAEQEPARARAALERHYATLIAEFKQKGTSQWIIDIAEAGRRAGLAEFDEQVQKPNLPGPDA